jgi:hypothetical protein
MEHVVFGVKDVADLKKRFFERYGTCRLCFLVFKEVADLSRLNIINSCLTETASLTTQHLSKSPSQGGGGGGHTLFFNQDMSS